VPDNVYREVQLGLKFTMGLHSTYVGLTDWPASLPEAFPEASKFKPRSGQAADVARANAFAMRGRGGGRGRSRGPWTLPWERARRSV
jgi:hypothetical protein